MCFNVQAQKQIFVCFGDVCVCVLCDYRLLSHDPLVIGLVAIIAGQINWLKVD